MGGAVFGAHPPVALGGAIGGAFLGPCPELAVGAAPVADVFLRNYYTADPPPTFPLALVPRETAFEICQPILSFLFDYM